MKMKTKVLIYCTKGKPYLHRIDDDTFVIEQCQQQHCSDYKKFYGDLNGTIVAECEVETERIDCLYNFATEKVISYFEKGENGLSDLELEKQSCLSLEELDNYLTLGTGYSLHISNLKIFDKPLELSECKVTKDYKNYSTGSTVYKAPMNMMWVWHNGERKALISIRPEWVCKILNGEKTIEVRRKVLKGMIQND